MKIQIAGLSEGIHHYKFHVASSELDLGEQFSGESEIDITLDKTPTQILLSSHIRTRARFECDRCVAPFEATLSPSYTMLYVHGGSESAHLERDEFQILGASHTVIDLKDDVRQTILLSVPLKLLCSDSCKGLCPTCGKNLNEGSCMCKEERVDAHWEQLRQLRSN